MNTAAASHETRLVPYYVQALAMALPAVMLGLQISGWIFFVKTIRDGHPDFRANYTAGYMVRTGQLHRLYDYNAIKNVQDRLVSQEKVGMPFIHPAYEALAYVPFSILGFRAAYFAFLAANLLLLCLCYRLLSSELKPLADAWRPLPMVLCLTFLPVGAALMQGQDSIILLTLFAGAWVLFGRNKDSAGGFVLGLALFRFQFLIPIYVLFLLWKKWRIVAGISLSAGISLLISVAMVGFGGARSYITALESMSVGGVPQVERLRYAQPVAAMGSLRALVAGTLGPWFPALWIQATIVILSAGILLWASRLDRSQTKSSDLILVAVTTSAIVGYHIFIHDMAILLLPMGVWLGRSIRFAGEMNSPMKRALWSSALLFASPMLIVFRVLHFYWITVAIILFLAAQLSVLRRSPPVVATEAASAV